MSVEEFRNYNDQDYLRWVADHHRGYVINIQRTYAPCSEPDALCRKHLRGTLTWAPAWNSAAPPSGSDVSNPR
jgi:hypothetical protein